jgi:hypothetical protein
MRVDLIHHRLVGDIEYWQRNRIRDWELYGTSESWKPFTISDDQRRRRANQSASERGHIVVRLAHGAGESQSDH